MALTKSFYDRLQSRVARDPDFAAALLREGIDVMLTGHVDTGITIPRDTIKPTVGFEKLAEAHPHKRLSGTEESQFARPGRQADCAA